MPEPLGQWVGSELLLSSGDELEWSGEELLWSGDELLDDELEELLLLDDELSEDEELTSSPPCGGLPEVFVSTTLKYPRYPSSRSSSITEFSPSANTSRASPEGTTANFCFLPDSRMTGITRSPGRPSPARDTDAIPPMTQSPTDFG